jgi:hypothetical protein
VRKFLENERFGAAPDLFAGSPTMKSMASMSIGDVDKLHTGVTPTSRRLESPSPQTPEAFFTPPGRGHVPPEATVDVRTAMRRAPALDNLIHSLKGKARPGMVVRSEPRCQVASGAAQEMGSLLKSTRDEGLVGFRAEAGWKVQDGLVEDGNFEDGDISENSEAEQTPLLGSSAAG